MQETLEVEENFQKTGRESQDSFCLSQSPSRIGENGAASINNLSNDEINIVMFGNELYQSTDRTSQRYEMMLR